MKNKPTKKGFDAVSNKDFANDMKKAYKGKKLKASNNPLDALIAKKKRPMMQAPMQQAPMAQSPMPQQPMMKKSKAKSSTKKKVSHVLQETSKKRKKTNDHDADDKKAKGTKKKVLTTNARKALPTKAFALPGRRYPIHDKNHARNALARVAQNGTPEEKAKVRAAVAKRFPGIGKA